MLFWCSRANCLGPLQSEDESSRLERLSRSNSNQRPDNSLDVASAPSSPTHSGSIASSCIQQNLGCRQSQYPSPPKLGHIQSSPYFQDDSASYSHPPLGVHQYSVSAFDGIPSQSANNAALDRPRPLEPRAWGSAHELAPGVSESPLMYDTQPTLQPPDDLAMCGYAPNSTSISLELAASPQPALSCQAGSNYSRLLGQSQTSYVDPSSLILDPDSLLIDAQRHLNPGFADNGWQPVYQHVSASHPPQLRPNATPPNTAAAAMQSALVHGPWSSPTIGFPDANPQHQVGPQQAPAARPTQFICYAAPLDASTAVTHQASTPDSTPDQHWAPWD